MSNLFFTRKLMKDYENSSLTCDNWNFYSKKKVHSSRNFTSYEYIFTSKDEKSLDFIRILFHFSHNYWLKFLSYENFNPFITMFYYEKDSKTFTVSYLHHNYDDFKEEYAGRFYSLGSFINHYPIEIPDPIKQKLAFHNNDYYLNFPLVKHYHNQNNYNNAFDVLDSASGCLLHKRPITPLQYMDKLLIKYDNIHDFTKSLFSNNRRDLIKAVAQSDIVTLSIAKAIYRSKTIPIERIIQFLQENKNINVYLETNDPEYPHRPFIISDIYNINNICKPSVLLSIMKEYTNFWNSNNTPRKEVELNDYFMMINDLSDSSIMLQELIHNNDKKYLFKINELKTKRGVTNYKTFHDTLTKIYNDYLLDNPKDYSDSDKINLTKSLKANKNIIKRIEKLSHSNVTYIVAQDPNDLIQWGSQMQHCLASYVEEMINGSSIFGAVIIDKIMVGNFQLKKKMRLWNLEQLLGKRNDLLEKELLNIIEKDLRKAGVITRKYIGKQ